MTTARELDMETEYNQSLARTRDRDRNPHAFRNLAHAAAALVARLETGPPLLLDGAMGTELERRGLNCDLPLWSSRALRDDPSVVEAIHTDYVGAGCEILTANTFRTQRRTLAKAGCGDRAQEWTTLAVELARNAAAKARHRVWIAGSAPPLEDCYRPEDVPGDAALEREHREHAENLERAGVDLVAVETHHTVRETLAAAAAARAVGLPFFVGFVCGSGATLLSGERLEDAVEATRVYGPLCVAVNCLPPSMVDACLPVLEAATQERDTRVAFGVYPNLGRPENGTTSEAASPAAFASVARGYLARGARLVGGCCGTTPEHTRALSQALDEAVLASGS